MTGHAVFHGVAMLGLLAALGLFRIRPRQRTWVLVALVALLGVAARLTGIGVLFSTLNHVFWILAWYAPVGMLGWTLAGTGSTRRKLLACSVWAAPLVGGAYARFVEPFWLEETVVEVRSARVDRPVRIVLASDIQTEAPGPWERAVLARIAARDPDLVVWTGDYVQTARRLRPNRVAELATFLGEAGIEPALGMVAVPGDVDRYGWQAAFDKTQTIASDETHHLELGPLFVTLLGLGDSYRLTAALPKSDRFHLVVGHRPGFALDTQEGDLLLAGHTHGGQVRLPLLGPLITLSRIPRAWAQGVTPLGEGRRLIVSRGLGLERGNAPRIRFLCRPQLLVVELVPEGQPVETAEAGSSSEDAAPSSTGPSGRLR